MAKLEQPFGKENLNQCFWSEAALCHHVLLPMWKSGVLMGDERPWDSLMAASWGNTVICLLPMSEDTIPDGTESRMLTLLG
jgi:hypothetical protein